jgi:hypothetical protein
MATRARFYFRNPSYTLARGDAFISVDPQALDRLASLKQRIRSSGLPVMEDYLETENYFRQTGNLENQQASLCGLANVLSWHGNLDGAMKLYQEQDQICRQLGVMDGLLLTLGGQAQIYFRRSELDEALRVHQELERLFRQSRRTDAITKSLLSNPRS